MIISLRKKVHDSVWIFLTVLKILNPNTCIRSASSLFLCTPIAKQFPSDVDFVLPGHEWQLPQHEFSEKWWTKENHPKSQNCHKKATFSKNWQHFKKTLWKKCGQSRNRSGAVLVSFTIKQNYQSEPFSIFLWNKKDCDCGPDW